MAAGTLKKYSVTDIQPGMIVGQPVFTETGREIIAEGTALTEKLIEGLIRLGIRDLVIVEYDFVSSMDKAYLLEEGFVSHYDQALQELKNVFQLVRFGYDINMGEIWDVTGAVIPLVDGGKAIGHIHNLHRSEEYLLHHSLHVAVLAGILARWLGYDNKVLAQVIVAGLLHDIGKMKVPDSIINKPGQLSSEEMDTVKLHTVRGYNMVKESRTLSKEVLCGILQHHERVDGQGYPIGLTGETIHQFAKIIAVADCYDAMTSDKVYGKKRTPFEVIEILADEMVAKLDVNICTVFLTQIRDCLNGYLVLLSDDRKAQIVHIPQKLKTLPVVRTEDGQFIDLEKNRTISLVGLLTE